MQKLKLMTLDQLVKILALVGIVLEPTTDTKKENLYVYATDEPGEGLLTLYIGMTASQTPGKRERDERRVATAEYMNKLQSGFAALVQENHAERYSFRFDPETFDPAVLLKVIEEYEWWGKPVDRIKQAIGAGDFRLSVADVEQILVRAHVCTGRLIGNSRGAGQWENVGGQNNVIATIATWTARCEGILPSGTVVETEDAHPGGATGEDKVVRDAVSGEELIVTQ